MYEQKRYNTDKDISLFGVAMVFFLALILAVCGISNLKDAVSVLDDDWPEQKMKTIHLKMPEAYVSEPSGFHRRGWLRIFTNWKEVEDSLRDVCFDDVTRRYCIPRYLFAESPYELRDRLNLFYHKPLKMDTYGVNVIRLEVEGEMVVDPEHSIPIYKEHAKEDMRLGVGLLAAAISSFALGIYSFRKWKKYNG